jgi:hypothetical protein
MGFGINKKLMERFFLERFLERLQMFPTKIECRECPDFLLHLEGRIVGVEVTLLHIRDSSPEPLAQAVESVTDRIVAEAQRLYIASGAPPAHVTVLFGSWIKPERMRRDLIANELVKLVQGMELETWERVVWRSNDEETSDPPLLDTVDSVHALGVPEHRMAHWTVSRAGWVATLTPEHLQSGVSKKSAKIDAYQEAARENWLLIVADGRKPSQAFSVPPDFPTAEVSSPFAKTFFYRYPDGEVIEVGTQPHEP